MHRRSTGQERPCLTPVPCPRVNSSARSVGQTKEWPPPPLSLHRLRAVCKCDGRQTRGANRHRLHPNGRGEAVGYINGRIEFNLIPEIAFIFTFSLLSSSRDSTYRDDDGRLLDEQLQSNGIIMKSSSCSSFLVDVLMKGIILFTNQFAWTAELCHNASNRSTVIKSGGEARTN